jgi:hypothetical protein
MRQTEGRVEGCWRGGGLVPQRRPCWRMKRGCSVGPLDHVAQGGERRGEGSFALSVGVGVCGGSGKAERWAACKDSSRKREQVADSARGAWQGQGRQRQRAGVSGCGYWCGRGWVWVASKTGAR